MMNSVDELYPLIRFLRIKPYNDWGRFDIEFGKVGSVRFKQPKDRNANDATQPMRAKREHTRDAAMTRLHVFLKSAMLRRKKDTEIDGKPICDLPPKHLRLENVEFSEDENALYRAIETRTQITVNKYLQKGTVTNNYANV